MTKQYKAVEPVGRFAKGDIIGGLPESQIKQLLADGVIKEHQAAVKTDDEPKAEGVKK